MKTVKTIDRNQKILDAATKFFLVHGFSGTTTDMIQKEAGVSKATLYACYKNKEVLFAAVIDQQCTDMQNEIILIESKATNLKLALIEIGKAYLTFLLSPKGLSLFRICIAEAIRFPVLSDQFFKVGPVKMTKIIAGYLTKASETGEIFDQGNSEVSATVFLGLLRSNSHLKYLTHPNDMILDTEIDLWVAYIVELFLKNLHYQEM